jgi:hypothetical protein
LRLGEHVRVLPQARRGPRGNCQTCTVLALLDAARTDAEAGVRVRDALRGAGTFRRCAFTVELYCQRAYRALEEAAPLEPARAALRSYVADRSFFAAGV